MKKLPLNRQELRSLIEDNCIYVDKTQDVYRLTEHATQYFFSRPRRFGKSLLISTLRELFEGNKDLFKGLWIYDKWEWKPYPVVHISFSSIGYQDLGLEKAIYTKINDMAISHGISLTKEGISQRFLELIKKMRETEKVVILIDEYDKPIIDYIDDIETAEKNRKILKNFYSTIKDNEDNIKFLFITGVSKFSRVSIFSDLNHLEDITLHEDFNSLVGITETELETYFADYIDKLQRKYKDYFPNIIEKIRDEYLGYSWDGQHFIYNPYSLIHLFSKQRFAAHWFISGTPTFLIKMLKNKHLTAFDLENVSATDELLDKYQIKNMTLIPLLFQTGYLTIKHIDLVRNIYKLGFPNKEIERAFSVNLIAEFNGKQSDKTQTILDQLTDYIIDGNVDKFIFVLKTLFQGVVYSHIEDKERYYHSIFYLVIKMIGFYINSEVMDATGRVDAVIHTEKQIIIVEFKTSTAEEAMQQIKEKQYYLKYMNENKEIILLAIGFDVEKRNISGYLTETVTEIL